MKTKRTRWYAIRTRLSFNIRILISEQIRVNVPTGLLIRFHTTFDVCLRNITKFVRNDTIR